MANNATWTPRPHFNVARGGLASATAGGRIHAIGGWTSGFATPLASVEAHQPGNNTWELVALMLTPHGNLGAAAVGNRIYAFGGFDTPDTGHRPCRAVRRLGQPAGTDPQAAGGNDRARRGGARRTNLCRGWRHERRCRYLGPRLQPADQHVHQGRADADARELLKVTELGGRLYAIGGVNDTGFLATVERYTRRPTPGKPLPR
jgi:Kelch motif